MRFVSLRTHSWHSLLEGVDSPQSLAEEAAVRGYAACALTDTNTVAGASEFAATCLAAGVRPLIGAAGLRQQAPHRAGVRAALLGAASPADLDAIAYLPAKQIGPLLQHARTSIGSLSGPAVEELLRDQVRQVRDASARQKRLEGLLVTAYRALPKTRSGVSCPALIRPPGAVLPIPIERLSDQANLTAPSR